MLIPSIINNKRKNGYKLFIWLLTITALVTSANGQEHQQEVKLKGLKISNVVERKKHNTNALSKKQHLSITGDEFYLKNVREESTSVKSSPNKVFSIYYGSAPTNNISNENKSFNINNNEDNYSDEKGNTVNGKKFHLNHGKKDSYEKTPDDNPISTNNNVSPTINDGQNNYSNSISSIKIRKDGDNKNGKIDNFLKIASINDQPDPNDCDNNKNNDHHYSSSTSTNSSPRKHHTFKVDHKKFEKIIMDDVKTMKKNEEEYIDVQFVRPNNNESNDQLKPFYVKKKFLSTPQGNGKASTNNTSIPLNKREDTGSKSKIQKRREMIREQSIKKLGKRELQVDKMERNYNSRSIKSNLLIFDYFCDFDISEDLCNKVEDTLKKCSQYLQKMINLKNTLYITVDFYSFCNSKNCRNKSSAVASSSPSCLYLLNDANGIEWSFPRALYKQFQSISAMELEEEDIYVQINNNFNFYFGDSDEFSNKYRDLLYILLHEITHGLGFLSFWDTTFSKDYPEIFNENTRTNGDYLIPQGYYSTTGTDIQFLGWVPLCIFDRYLIYHEEYSPIYNLYLDMINSSRVILRNYGGRMPLSQFIQAYEDENSSGFLASKFLYSIATGKAGSISFGVPSREYIENSFDTEFKYITLSNYIPLQSFCDLWSSSSSISHIDYSYIETSDFLMVYMAKKGKSLNSLINNGIDTDGWDIKEPEDGIYPIWGPDTQKIMKAIGWDVVMEERQIFSRNITHRPNECEYYLAKAASSSTSIHHQFWNKNYSTTFIYLLLFNIIYFIFI